MREDILEAIGNVDTDLIEQVDTLRSQPEKRFNFRLLMLIAACVCITISVGVMALDFIGKYQSDNMTANDEDYTDGTTDNDYHAFYAKVKITETDEHGFFGTVVESEIFKEGDTIYVTGVMEIGFDTQNSVSDTVYVSFNEIGSDEGEDADTASKQINTVKAIRIERGE